jgi:hypothetical protein
MRRVTGVWTRNRTQRPFARIDPVWSPSVYQSPSTGRFSRAIRKLTGLPVVRSRLTPKGRPSRPSPGSSVARKRTGLRLQLVRNLASARHQLDLSQARIVGPDQNQRSLPARQNLPCVFSRLETATAAPSRRGVHHRCRRMPSMCCTSSPKRAGRHPHLMSSWGRSVTVNCWKGGSDASDEGQ